jgi:hypothetical protein
MGYCSCYKIIIERVQNQDGWGYLVTYFDYEIEAGCIYRKVPYKPETKIFIDKNEAFTFALKMISQLSM